MEIFKKLCLKCNIKVDDEFNSFSVPYAKYSEATGAIEMQIVFDHHITLSKFRYFYESLNKCFPNLDLKLSVRFNSMDAHLIFDYLLLAAEMKNKPLYNELIKISKTNVSLSDGTYLTITSSYKKTLDVLSAYKDTINAFLVGWGFKNISLKLSLKKEETKDTNKEIERLISEASAQIEESKKMVENEQKKTAFVPRKSSPREYKQIAIKDIDIEYVENVEIKGQVFGIDERKIRDNFVIKTFTVSDFSEAITAKIINKDIEIKENSFVSIKGKIEMDPYLKRKILRVDSVVEIEPLWNNKTDNAPEKRIELALRSNMSTQDGVVSASDYIKTAQRYGHQALAITDIDGVQAFPDFFNATKKLDSLKPIYGATLSSITKDNGTVLSSQDFDLATQRYIVFDLETSGLSPIFDEIIEFGAVIVENGETIDKIQFFVKPSKPISKFTTELTNITNEMLETYGISQEEAAHRIHKILSSGIAVAHNANFDISHSKELFKRWNLPYLDIKGIDTMFVARILFPLNSKFRLGVVAKKFDVVYDEETAHRADQDAKVLAEIWIKMISKLARDLEITTSAQLRQKIDPEFYRKKFPYEIRLLAKNQKGLKKLFQIVSKGSTEDYHNGLRVFLEDIQKGEDLLIGTSTHLSYFWDKVFTGCSEDIEKEITHYDYIEFAPLSTMEYRVARGDINSLEAIKTAYKMVIELAKKHNIPCVAVSDARYTEEIEKILHHVYIFADGVGGKKHWLYSFKDQNTKAYPVLDYKTTEEMLAEFSFLNDDKLIKEIVIYNTHLIANQIEKIEVIKKDLFKPIFDDSTNKLTELVYKTAHERYGEILPEAIAKRIDRELKPITENGYSVIYWISHKLVKKSNDEGYLVGSRGSVGSSIVANLSGISEVNPLNPHYLCSQCKFFEMFDPSPELSSGWDLKDKLCPNCAIPLTKDGHSIPFETFLGFNADKVPDIDLNFSGDYQAYIHNYVRELFGESHTFRAGTISTIASKTAYGFVKKYDEIVNTQSRSFSTAYIEFLAGKSTGVKRTTGQHPGGIIIVPKEYDVEDFTPINYPANDKSSDWKTTHFDFHSIHDNLLKLDILGHDDPTAIRMLERLTKINVKNIPKSDEKVIKLFSTTESLNIDPNQIDGEVTGAKGLPEFGTQFVRRMLKSAKAKKFSDLISLSGLSHGTDVWTGNAEELIKKYNFDLSQLVCCRDDIMNTLILHQVDPKKSFDIMEKVRKGKGLTPEEENLLRDHNVPDWYIESLQKIKYMFPKAHATAYVIMAWRIAWFKIYYPLEYYATYFTTRTESNDIKVLSDSKEAIDQRIEEINTLIRNKQSTTKEQNYLDGLEIGQELYARGYKILNVDLERSLAKEWVIDYDKKALIPPFINVDSLGESVAESIINARNQNPFLSVEDLQERTQINSRILENLKSLNILDKLDENNNISLFD
ncbi:PolC-type DNA polymerase III [Mycoplasma sp. 128]